MAGFLGEKEVLSRERVKEILRRKSIPISKRK
jgi:hypothetical protein